MPEPKTPEETLRESIDLHPAFNTGSKENYHPASIEDDDGTTEKFYDANSDDPEPTKQEEAPTRQEPAEKGDKLFAGKYKSVEELEKGYANAQKELYDRNAENIALRTAKAVINEGGYRREREEPTKPEFVKGGYNPEGDPVMKREDIEATVRDTVVNLTREEVQRALAPMTALSNAQSTIQQRYPEYSGREQEFTQWLTDNPDNQREVFDNPEGNLEVAYLRFERDNRVAETDESQRSQRTVEAARAHAGTITPSAGGRARGNTDAAANQQLLELYKHGKETGNMRPYKDARTAHALGPGFMRSLEKTNWGR